MDGIFKKPYEISLWEDELAFHVKYIDKETGELLKEEDFTGALPSFDDDAIKQISQYYKEIKLCVIGSNTIDTPIRATAGKLISNVNGSNTLTFNLYSHYYDEETRQLIKNPYIHYMVNERKVKLRYGPQNDCEWYDFVIKDIKENSENRTFSYTCKDLFINELSKSGFNIQLNQDLENNMGNVTYLAEKILDESDWELNKEECTTLQQTKEEPLYAVKLKLGIEGAKNMEDKTAEAINIPAGETIYVFYSIIENKEPYFQFLYKPDGDYEYDDDRVIMNIPNYYKENVSYSDEDGRPEFCFSEKENKNSVQISSKYKGRRLVRQAITVFDPVLDGYVNVYEKNDVEYYGYTKTEYITPTAVVSYFTNGGGFVDDSGWEKAVNLNGQIASTSPIIELVGFPDIRQLTPEQLAEVKDFKSYLKIKQTDSNQRIYNTGFADHRSSIHTLAKDEKFVFRAKIGRLNNNSVNLIAGNSGISFQIAEYKVLENNKYVIGDTYFEGTLNFKKKGSETGDEWLYASADNYVNSKVSRSYSELISKRVGIFFNLPLNTDFYFENVQFYRYVKYERLKQGSDTDYETVVAEPGGELFSAARTKYIYYQKSDDYKTADDIVPEYEGYTNDESFVKQYNTDEFEKIRSITASESNRFNMIQDLCEIFECWAKFKIEHKPNGEILLGKDKDWGGKECPEHEKYRQQKWISFHEYIGNKKFVGFKYGINLKSISRTLNSDGIVSKIVVKDNSNEFAPNGFCSIARAVENPSGENFIYNFDYYIQHGLLDRTDITNDLYMDVNGYIGYYKKLKRLNAEREEKIEEQSKLLVDLSQYSANFQAYYTALEAAQGELERVLEDIDEISGFSLEKLQTLSKMDENANGLSIKEKEDIQKAKSWWADDKIIGKFYSYVNLQSQIAKFTELSNLEYCEIEDKETGKIQITGRLYEAEQKSEELQEYIDNLANEKRALNLQFYKKYSRFIQEGSWISEDYTDENLYYLDAESTLYTSSRPKVTYTINVLELSQLPGYENYRFSLGDKTFIEDTEFFGWVWNTETGVRSPYHEEIVISEFTVVLDSPESNTFKVQNFKTQFEDLFQRITATTQSIEFHSGEYGRASSIVTTDGSIAADTLESSFENNTIRLENAKDQTTVWDETGITSTSMTNPNEIIRLYSGGIFLTKDGGATWSTGISADGINANFITAGQINTSIITIKSGKFTSFRWDDVGLNAYAFSTDSNGKPYGFNNSKFVRFDQYGLYGINGIMNFDPNIASATGLKGEDKIWDNAKFALTWKGFMLRNDDGSVRIDSEQDIQVVQAVDGENYERIKIGRIGEITKNGQAQTLYGIKISQLVYENGKVKGTATVMETDSEGKLWLRDALSVGEESTSTVQLGYLKGTRTDEKGEFHEVIHAGDSDQTPFIVYEDGHVIANYIVANGGKIGTMEIESIEDRGYEVVITSNVGNSMKTGQEVELTATLYKGVNPVTTGVSYQWYNKDGDIPDATSQQYKISAVQFNNGFTQYGCKITLS